MALAVDQNGWITTDMKGPRVFYLPTVRTCALETRKPIGLVWHATGGVGGRGYAERLLRRIQTYRRGLDRAASFHVLVDRTGAVFQAAPLSVGTWHVGRPGRVAGRSFDNVNKATVGVELENAGELRAVGDGFYTWPYFLEPNAPARERRPDPRLRVARLRASLFSDGRFYDNFPPAQIATAIELVRACRGRYGFKRQAAAHGHCDFGRPTKTDPGALWMRGVLPRVLAGAFGPADATPAETSS